MSDPYIGEIKAFTFNFTPQNWLLCNGQELSVNQYQALYAVIGNTYGGTPQKTFKVPNLMPSYNVPGLALLGAGTGASGTAYPLGGTSGVQTVTLSPAQQPPHTHTVSAIIPTMPETSTPVANTSYLSRLLASGTNTKEFPYIAQATTPTPVPNVTMNANTMGPSYTNTSATAHDNMQPYLALNICIAWYGWFPTPG